MVDGSGGKGLPIETQNGRLYWAVVWSLKRHPIARFGAGERSWSCIGGGPPIQILFSDKQGLIRLCPALGGVISIDRPTISIETCGCIGYREPILQTAPVLGRGAQSHPKQAHHLFLLPPSTKQQPPCSSTPPAAPSAPLRPAPSRRRKYYSSIL